jgi:hypothetical protein
VRLLIPSQRRPRPYPAHTTAASAAATIHSRPRGCSHGGRRGRCVYVGLMTFAVAADGTPARLRMVGSLSGALRGVDMFANVEIPGMLR